MKKLLIVESPAKAKTIGKYLGKDFTVKSSVGHIRDLPKHNGSIAIDSVAPGRWNFTPTYEVSEGKEKVVKELKAAVKGADAIYLASDPDREGEAIAWHLREVLKSGAKDKPFYRVTYNEITKPAVLKAVSEPRDIDMPRVDAQQARRILDRLVGYKVSPILWKNIHINNAKTLSAGRVQSVALRLLVERQREIDAFKPETYFVIGVEAQKRTAAAERFVARLARFDGEKPDIRDRQTADNMMVDLSHSFLKVADLKARPKVRHALPPFTTSTLQQAASSVLGFSPGKTMKSAQKLYEMGAITYMRTDSVNVSDLARKAAEDFIKSTYGAAFYPEKPNFYKSKADAQGAHEAIRPTDIALTPDRAGFDSTDLKLYDLIWRRFVASQMSDAKTTVKTAFLEPEKPALMHRYVFTASATEIEFEGFLKVMKLSLKNKKASEEESQEDSDEVDKLPKLELGEALDVHRFLSDEKQTKGPSHYSEASLIKALEENGVGRPSTYAQTIETLKTREYAVTEKKKLVPTERGTVVCDYLVKHLDALFSVGYTAKMEAELDKVEEHGESMNDMLSGFYGRFTAALKESAQSVPPPDKSKFDLVFALLAQVKEWKQPVRDGRRLYDDRKFYESVKEQGEAGKTLSERQLVSLVRMVIDYAGQIPDAERRLREAGLAGNIASQMERADPELVKLAFAAFDSIKGIKFNSFMKSLRDQFEHNHPLSLKQFVILAKTLGENAAALPQEWRQQVFEKLAPFVPGGIALQPADPSIMEMLDIMRSIKDWRKPVSKGRKTYDDKAFVNSLSEQYARRRTLSSRQMMALKRVVVAYKDQIPDFATVSARLGLDKVPSSDDKEAEVIGGE